MKKRRYSHEEKVFKTLNKKKRKVAQPQGRPSTSTLYHTTSSLHLFQLRASLAKKPTLVGSRQKMLRESSVIKIKLVQIKRGHQFAPKIEIKRSRHLRLAN